MKTILVGLLLILSCDELLAQTYKIIFVQGTVVREKTNALLKIGDDIDKSEALEYNSPEAKIGAFNPKFGRITLGKSGTNFASTLWEPICMQGPLAYLSAPYLYYKNFLPVDDSTREGNKFLILGKRYEHPVYLTNDFTQEMYALKDGGGFYLYLRYTWMNADGSKNSAPSKSFAIETYKNRLVFDHILFDKISEERIKMLTEAGSNKDGVFSSSILYRNNKTMVERAAYFYPVFPAAEKVRKGAAIVKEIMEKAGKPKDEIVDSLFAYFIAYFGMPEPSNALRWMKENLELTYSAEAVRKRFGFPELKNNLLVLDRARFEVVTNFLPDISPDQYVMLSYTLNNKRIEDTVNLSWRNEIVLEKEFWEAENDFKAIETLPVVLFYYNNADAPVKISEFNIVMPNLENLKQKIAPVVENMRNDGKSVGQIQREAIRVMNEFYGRPEEEDALRWLDKTFNLQ